MQEVGGSDIHSRRKHGWLFWIGAIGGLLACALMLGLYVWKFWGEFSPKQEAWGQFGDYVGGVLNPIFGFAGFLILITTLVDQRRQIGDEQKYTEAERKARELKDFEVTFFQLLHVFNEVVANLHYTKAVLFATPSRGEGGIKTRVERGREAMRAMFIAFQKSCRDDSSGDKIVDKVQYGERNKKLYLEWQHELGIYFRSLYHVFKFVDTSDLPYEKKTQYANIARAQLSSYELAMIFYNGLWGEGLTGFRPLIEKYGILKHLKAETVLRASDLDDRTMYAETARANHNRRMRIWEGKIPVIQYD